MKARGMLQDTLVVWTTEFGRMPMFQQGAQGAIIIPRIHDLAGGRRREARLQLRRTHEFGHRAVDRPATIYDFHATILHLLGLDHTRLTYTHNGADRRLTDVHGHVISDILA